jgi:hypothetical protein
MKIEIAQEATPISFFTLWSPLISFFKYINGVVPRRLWNTPLRALLSPNSAAFLY